MSKPSKPSLGRPLNGKVEIEIQLKGKGTGLDTAPFIFAGWNMDEGQVDKAKKVFENHIPAYLLSPSKQEDTAVAA